MITIKPCEPTTGGNSPVCYNPEMTRAQAIALRDSGGLDPNCVVVIVDAPDIVRNKPSESVPSRVELNPVSATDLGILGRVWHEQLANAGAPARMTSAWACIYDLDRNVFVEITDNLGNTITDATGEGTNNLIWGQNPKMRNNTIKGNPVLTGWSNPNLVIENNTVEDINAVGVRTVVDLSGLSDGQVIANYFGYNFVLNGATRSGVIVLNEFRTDITVTDGTSTTIIFCDLGGVGAVWTGDFTLYQAQGAFGLQGSGSLSIFNATGSGQIVGDDANIFLSSIILGEANISTNGLLNLSAASLTEGAILTVTGRTNLYMAGHQQSGGQIQHQRDGGAEFWDGNRLHATVVFCDGDPAPSNQLTRMDLSAASLSLHSVANLQSGSTISGSSVFVNKQGRIIGCRFAAGAAVTTDYVLTNVIVDGLFNKTAGGDQTGTLANAGFDNFI